MQEFIEKNYLSWRDDFFFDEYTRREVASICDLKEIEDRFYRDLEFGTGGMRGVMGAGTNRMNKYVVRKATAGLANYLRDTSRGNLSVVIAYDTRRNSREFALEAALTLCAAGIKSYLFDKVSPTPLLSFAVRHLNCNAGIVITASHNPKEYNGYKVYNRDGCQIVPKYADEIIKYINSLEITSLIAMEESEAAKNGLLNKVGDDVLNAFTNAVLSQANPVDVNFIKIVYSPLHGAGNRPLRAVLERIGFNVSIVHEQELPDGDFPTVHLPNPEDADALNMGIKLAEHIGADLVIGTDPDCDRVGAAVRDENKFHLLSGNQIGALIVNYVLTRRKELINSKSTIIKTIVTSELGASIARAYGVNIVETLTGFKYIGEQICLFEQNGSKEFVAGYEESYGYLVGTHARDKDAIVSSMLLCEMTAYYKAYGKTLIEVLDSIYDKYGYYLDALDSFELKGKEGILQIKNTMDKLRKDGLNCSLSITEVQDYKLGVCGLPQSDVLKFYLEDGSWIAIRPSGTEPKIKVYYSMRSQNRYKEKAFEKLEECRKAIKTYLGVE
jgi:phosphoglucomutase